LVFCCLGVGGGGGLRRKDQSRKRPCQRTSDLIERSKPTPIVDSRTRRECKIVGKKRKPPAKPPYLGRMYPYQFPEWEKGVELKKRPETQKGKEESTKTNKGTWSRENPFHWGRITRTGKEKSELRPEPVVSGTIVPKTQTQRKNILGEKKKTRPQGRSKGEPT